MVCVFTLGKNPVGGKPESFWVLHYKLYPTVHPFDRSACFLCQADARLGKQERMRFETIGSEHTKGARGAGDALKAKPAQKIPRNPSQAGRLGHAYRKRKNKQYCVSFCISRGLSKTRLFSVGYGRLSRIPWECRDFAKWVAVGGRKCRTNQLQHRKTPNPHETAVGWPVG